MATPLEPNDQYQEHHQLGYRAGSFLLASPRKTLLATGVREVVAEPDPEELAARVTKLLTDSDAPLAVGALPFDSDKPHIVLAGAAGWSPRLRRPPVWERQVVAPVRVEPVPAPEVYRDAVGSAVSALRAGELRKVVLARALQLTFGEPVDIGRLLASLVADNTAGYTYAVDLPHQRAGGRTLVGASPELLLSRTGTRVLANPIAGTIARDADPARDAANAEALRSSAKDLDEHLLVVDAVVDALRPFCRRLAVAGAPELVSTPAVWHLSTRVIGELHDPGVSSLRLACALHPTPAVCGTPTDLARETIAELEPFERGFYGGAVGWCDADGDGEWVVAIRCAEVRERTMRLFSGAGIMPASDPELELAETTAKFRTLLHAMGLDLTEQVG